MRGLLLGFVAIGCAISIGFVLFTGLPVASAQDAPSPTLVISTPTPTPNIVILPTVTPHPGQANSASGEDRYTVQADDTLLSVALEMGIDLDEMGCVLSPEFSVEQPLVIGDLLRALPDDMICHQVAEGESLTSIAALYGVATESIVSLPWNRLTKELAAAPELPIGRFVRVPVALASSLDLPVSVVRPADGRFLSWILTQPVNSTPHTGWGTGGVRREASYAPVPADWPYGSGSFTWPSYGWLTQGYRRDHRAIDIAAPVGAPVTAADRGVVLRSGWNSQGYGNFVVIDHNIDIITLYAHLDTIFVEVGDVVAQGQVLGTVGSTGNSTGPHLHFEIRDFGRLVNPLEWLAR